MLLESFQIRTIKENARQFLGGDLDNNSNVIFSATSDEIECDPFAYFYYELKKENFSAEKSSSNKISDNIKVLLPKGFAVEEGENHEKTQSLQKIEKTITITIKTVVDCRLNDIRQLNNVATNERKPVAYINSGKIVASYKAILTGELASVASYKAILTGELAVEEKFKKSMQQGNVEVLKSFLKADLRQMNSKQKSSSAQKIKMIIESVGSTALADGLVEFTSIEEAINKLFEQLKKTPLKPEEGRFEFDPAKDCVVEATGFYTFLMDKTKKITDQLKQSVTQDGLILGKRCEQYQQRFFETRQRQSYSLETCKDDAMLIAELLLELEKKNIVFGGGHYYLRGSNSYYFKRTQNELDYGEDKSNAICLEVVTDPSAENAFKFLLKEVDTENYLGLERDEFTGGQVIALKNLPYKTFWSLSVDSVDNETIPLDHCYYYCLTSQSLTFLTMDASTTCSIVNSARNVFYFESPLNSWSSQLKELTELFPDSKFLAQASTVFMHSSKISATSFTSVPWFSNMKSQPMSRLFNEILPKLEAARSKPLICVLGNSGSGKSAFVNTLLRHPLMMNHNSILEAIDNDQPSSKMSMKSTISETFYPTVFDYQGEVYCDFPGVSDSRLEFEELNIFASLIVQKIAAGIKAVVIIIDPADLSSSRGVNFKNLLQNLQKLISKNSLHYEQKRLFFVMNQKGREMNGFKNINSLIDEIKKTEKEKLNKLQKMVVAFQRQRTEIERKKNNAPMPEEIERKLYENWVNSFRSNLQFALSIVSLEGKLPEEITDPLVNGSDAPLKQGVINQEFAICILEVMASQTLYWHSFNDVACAIRLHAALSKINEVTKMSTLLEFENLMPKNVALQIEIVQWAETYRQSLTSLLANKNRLPNDLTKQQALLKISSEELTTLRQSIATFAKQLENIHQELSSFLQETDYSKISLVGKAANLLDPWPIQTVEIKAPFFPSYFLTFKPIETDSENKIKLVGNKFPNPIEKTISTGTKEYHFELYTSQIVSYRTQTIYTSIPADTIIGTLRCLRIDDPLEEVNFNQLKQKAVDIAQKIFVVLDKTPWVDVIKTLWDEYLNRIKQANAISISLDRWPFLTQMLPALFHLKEVLKKLSESLEENNEAFLEKLEIRKASLYSKNTKFQFDLKLEALATDKKNEEIKILGEQQNYRVIYLGLKIIKPWLRQTLEGEVFSFYVEGFFRTYEEAYPNSKQDLVPVSAPMDQTKLATDWLEDLILCLRNFWFEEFNDEKNNIKFFKGNSISQYAYGYTDRALPKNNCAFIRVISDQLRMNHYPFDRLDGVLQQEAWRTVDKELTNYIKQIDHLKDSYFKDQYNNFFTSLALAESEPIYFNWSAIIFKLVNACFDVDIVILNKHSDPTYYLRKVGSNPTNGTLILGVKSVKNDVNKIYYRSLDCSQQDPNRRSLSPQLEKVLNEHKRLASSPQQLNCVAIF